MVTMAQQPTLPKIPDAYHDLGLQSNASTTEIKAAYHKLALLHHPDKNLTENDTAQFRRVNEAYECLKNEQSKTRYDQQYTRVQADWAKYKQDVSEFTQNPEAWRRKRASAPRAQPATHTHSHYYHDGYDDSNESDGYCEDAGYGFFEQFVNFAARYTNHARHGPSYSSSSYDYEARRAQEDREFEAFVEQNMRMQREYDEDLKKRLSAEAARRKQESLWQKAVDNANRRAIERQQEESDKSLVDFCGIRVYSPEEKLAMAKTWVQGVQSKYRQELHDAGVDIYHLASDSPKAELGWERKKGRCTCHFCDAQVHEYSFRCPFGGAIACRVCKNAMTSASSFAFMNTYAGARKGNLKKKARRAKARMTTESGSEDPGEVEEDADFGKEAEKLARELAAREEEAQRKEKACIEREKLEARRVVAREAHQKAAREAEEKAAREKAIAAAAAREKAVANEAARIVAEERKATRAKELAELKAQKKAARKKATKERIAIEKAKERAAKEEEEKPPREARKKEAREREEPEVEEINIREQEVQSAHEHGILESELHKSNERRMREAEEARQESSEREAQEAREKISQLSTVSAEQRAKMEAKHQAMEELLRQQAREAREGIARAEHQPLEYTARRAERLAREREEQQARLVKSEVKIRDKSTTAGAEATSKLVKKTFTGTTLFCIVCKESGHVARRCPKKDTEFTADVTSAAQAPLQATCPTPGDTSASLEPDIVALSPASSAREKNIWR